jgi:tetratricopeptide (TPR) repeat protein
MVPATPRIKLRRDKQYGLVDLECKNIDMFLTHSWRLKVREYATSVIVRDSSMPMPAQLPSWYCPYHFMSKAANFICAGFVILSFILVPRCLFVSAVAAPAPGSDSFEATVSQATTAREAGKTSEAITKYRDAVKLRPTWEEGWWYLGTLLYDADEFGQAIPALRHVVELDPNIGVGWAFLGLCEFESGDYTESFTHLQNAARLGFADDPEIKKITLYHLGLLLNMRGEFDRAPEILRDAAGSSAVPEQIETALGMSLLRVPLLPSQLDTSNDALIRAAGETSALLLNHQSGPALRNFEQMLEEYPHTPYLHYQYGLALQATGKDKEAQLQFQEEIRERPADGLAWIASAKFNLQRKKFKEAVADAKRATQLAPRSAAAYEVLAQACQVQDKAEAAEASRKATELAKLPAVVDQIQAKRYAISQVADVNTDPKGADVTSGVADAPAKFQETARLAESARHEGRLDEAAMLYQEGTKVRPEWQEGWRQLGTVEYMRQHYQQAVATLRRSVALDATQPDTWTLLGLSEFQTQDYKNSRIHLERGRALGFSGNAAAVTVSRYHLALLSNLNSAFDEAIALLIPEAGHGPLSDDIEFAMGIALLRIPALPEQIDPGKHTLVRSAGEAAVLLSGSYYDKAFQIFEKLLTENPGTPFLHYAYGDALASASKYDAAQAQLMAETRLNQRSALAYIRLASIALVLRQSASAIQYASKATALAPESAEGHYELGRAFLEQGDISHAIEELESARRLAPKSSKVHFNLARAYTRANRAPEAEQERLEFEKLKGDAAQPASYGDRAVRLDANDESSQQSPK